jgi:GntR family transcriptional regulator/MocR family aminotransferase
MLEQVVLDPFIREGHFGRHLRRMRSVYAERLSVLLEEARSQGAGLLEMSRVQAGLQTTAWLRCAVSDHSAAAAAAKRGVEVTPVSVYAQGPPKEQALQLGFAAVTPREIRKGMTELAAALEGELKALGRGQRKKAGGISS